MLPSPPALRYLSLFILHRYYQLSSRRKAMQEKPVSSPRESVLPSPGPPVQEEGGGHSHVKVVDFVRATNVGSKELYDPEERTFDGSESFSEFLRQPYEKPTVARLIHARNTPWVLGEVAKYTGRSYPELATWMERPALAPRAQEKVWVPKLSPNYNDLQFGYDFFSTNGDGKHCCPFYRRLDSIKFWEMESSQPKTIGVCLKKLGVLAFSMKEHFSGDHPAAVVLVMEDTQGCPSGFAIPTRIDRPSEYSDKNPADSSLRILDHILYWVLRETGNAWWNIISCHQAHLIRVEQEIFLNPVNEEWGDTLWRLSNDWNIYNRALTLQLRLMEYLKRRINQFLDAHYDSWLTLMKQEFPEGHAYGSLKRTNKIQVFGRLDKMFGSIQSELSHALIVPTTNLLDMIYKRVAIRDAQNSLRLNESLWRLSWITFIFLPLTFLCGFFGMNVNTFGGNPDIKWWFIAAVPLMVIVFVLWFVFRRIQDASARRESRNKLLELDPIAQV